MRMPAAPFRAPRLLPESLTGRVFVLFGGTLAALVLAGLALFIQFQFRQQVEETQQNAQMLISLMSQAVQDSVIIGDYDAVQRTLQKGVQGSAFDAVAFIDRAGAVLRVEDSNTVRHWVPELLLRWVKAQLYEVNEVISVGGRDYGVLRLRFDAENMAAQLWSLTLRTAAIGAVSLLLGLVIMRWQLRRWMDRLDQLQAFEQALRDGDVDAANLAQADAPTEIRRLAEMLARSATLLNEREASRRELDHQKFALDQHAIVSITDASGIITYANDKFCEISGFARDELIGQNHRIVKSGLLPPEFYEQLWQTILAGRVWHGEICNRKKSGELYWVNATIVPLPGTDGRPARYIAIRTDITDRKSIEASLEVARVQAERANRAKSAFLATMSHEIRTPMNAIIGFSHLLQREIKHPTQRTWLDMVVRSGEHLMTIINDILDFSKIEANELNLTLRPLDAAAVAAQVVALMRPAAEAKGLVLTLQVQSVPAPLLGDATRLTQALLNLVNNAVKFTPRGSVAVGVSLALEQADAALLRFEVRDTGIGIAPEALPELFAPFHQADNTLTREFEGTGLGLVITRRLARLMGGDAGVVSSPGQGSTFWFTARLPHVPDGLDLPAVPAAVPAAGDAAQAGVFL